MISETLLKRDRWLLLGGLALTTLAAWAYMVREARAMTATGICQCAGMQMSGPDLNPWSTSTLLPLFLMWSEMMVAMMLPSAAPMILTFARVNRQRRTQERPYVHTLVFVSGYLAVWTLFSALAALAQWVLHGKALLSPAMASQSRWLGASILIGAGLFQWTPLKQACLGHCRSTLSFLLTEWREGRWGAFLMGFRHGGYCTGCCWILMALLFVAGVMNLWWIAALTALVLIEKAAARGLFVARTSGVVLAAWGLVVLFRGS